MNDNIASQNDQHTELEAAQQMIIELQSKLIASQEEHAVMVKLIKENNQLLKKLFIYV